MLEVETLNKIVDYYRNADQVCVLMNGDPYDTDFTEIWAENNELHFKFWCDDMVHLKIAASEIEEINYQEDSDIVIVSIKLKAGDRLLIHNMFDII